MVKVAFVGCGGIQQEHYKHLALMNDVAFVGHCDIDPSRAESASKSYGGQAYSDYETMYEKAKPDAVYISVPPFAHTGMEEAAAKRGIHLFIEKPLGVSRPTAKRIATVLKSTRVLSSVGYCWRYLDTVAHARQFLKGKPVSLVSACWNGGMPEVWWWRRMDKSGGQIIEQTTHLFDLIRYLCGEIAEVHAVASTGCMTQVERFDVHDSSVVSLRLKSGAVGAVTSSCVANHSERVGVEIVTPDATVSLTSQKLTICEDGRTTDYCAKVNMYYEENRTFIDAIISGKPSKIRSPYSDAIRTFSATCAASDSVRSGLPTKP